MDKKLLYMAKTLSRTKRKDYENYVINSIWNGVKTPDLVPVSQQCIKGKDGKHYFIDLYFPQLNIGIECDEQYHESIKFKDIERELNIFDVLNQVNDISTYKPLHVKVNESTSLKEVDQQISICINKIKEEINRKETLGDGWNKMFNDPYVFYCNKEYIKISDNVTFKTSKDIYNTIFAKNYSSSPRRGGISLNDGILVWMPQLAINGKARASGWYNEISPDGSIITEYNIVSEKNEDRNKEQKHINQTRVVFTKTKDFVTGIDEYRFVGVFKAMFYDKNNALIYKKIDDKFKIIRK